MKLLDILLYKVLPLLAKGYINLVGRTSRIRVINKNHMTDLAQKGQPVLFAVWHENIVVSPYLYSTTMGGNKLAAMVSRSQDGEIMTRVLEKFGAVCARGSSSRGGPTALLQMVELIKGGKDGVIMVDGPRGPALTAQPGVLKLAQLTGAPVIPCGVEVRRRARLRSWDRLKIPFPLNRIGLYFGTPLWVPPEAGDAELESLRQLLENDLKQGGRLAAELISLAPQGRFS